MNMTPTELHKRILLHEIRTILLDETREGTRISDGHWKSAILDDPHNTTPYLILANWLEEQCDDLGELIRIQCELIGKLTPTMYHWTLNQNHPFYNDFCDYREHDFGHFLERRWELTQELYPLRKCEINHSTVLEWADELKAGQRTNDLLEQAGFDTKGHPIECVRDEANRVWVYTQERKLGRTTRMLTDVLRYCWANRDKKVLVVHEQPKLAQSLFMELFFEIYGDKHDFHRGNASNIVIYKNLIRFVTPPTTPRHNNDQPDITFTDHRTNPNFQIRPDNGEMAMDPLNYMTFNPPPQIQIPND